MSLLNLKIIKQNFYSHDNTEFINNHIQKYFPQFANTNTKQIN